MLFRKTLLFFFVLGVLSFAHKASAAVSVVLPNGGELYLTQTAYTIELTNDNHHVAIYYRTDGNQPTHLDSSVIKHPLVNKTTWNWTPNLSHESLTGRIWVQGHLANHTSTGDWDDSDMNFEVRDCGCGGGGGEEWIWCGIPLECKLGSLSSCAALCPSAPGGVCEGPFTSQQECCSDSTDGCVGSTVTIVPDTGGSTSPVFFSQSPNSIAAIADSPFSILYTFQLPNISLSEVELYTTTQTKEEQFTSTVITSTSTINLAANEKYWIQEADLIPNTRYQNRFLRGKVPPQNYTTKFSLHFQGVYTLIETPSIAAETVDVAKIVIAVTSTLSNLYEGLSGISFTNLTTSENTGWIRTTSWAAENLDPDSTYQFLVQARNGDGIQTPYGDLLTVKTEPLPLPLPPIVTVPTTPSVTPPPLFVDGALLRASDSFDIWVIQQGSRRHVPNAGAFIGAGYQWDAVREVSGADLAKIPAIRLMKTTKSPSVWYVNNGFRRWVPNPAVFALYGFSWDEVYEVSEGVLETYAIVTLLKSFSDFRVWFIEGGFRRWITTAEVFKNRGFSWNEVIIVFPEELTAYPEGHAL